MEYGHYLQCPGKDLSNIIYYIHLFMLRAHFLQIYNNLPSYNVLFQCVFSIYHICDVIKVNKIFFGCGQRLYRYDGRFDGSQSSIIFNAWSVIGLSSENTHINWRQR